MQDATLTGHERLPSFFTSFGARGMERSACMRIYSSYERRAQPQPSYLPSEQGRCSIVETKHPPTSRPSSIHQPSSSRISTQTPLLPFIPFTTNCTGSQLHTPQPPPPPPLYIIPTVHPHSLTTTPQAMIKGSHGCPSPQPCTLCTPCTP